MKRINSVYGLKQAPPTFFEKLWNIFLKRGFVPFKMDKRLFITSDMICLFYIYDKALSVQNAKSIE